MVSNGLEWFVYIFLMAGVSLPRPDVIWLAGMEKRLFQTQQENNLERRRDAGDTDHIFVQISML